MIREIFHWKSVEFQRAFPADWNLYLHPKLINNIIAVGKHYQTIVVSKDNWCAKKEMDSFLETIEDNEVGQGKVSFQLSKTI